jgi:hypothetical protein
MSDAWLLSGLVAFPAWLAAFGVLRPLSLLTVRPRDFAYALCCLAVSAGLFWLSYKISGA